MSEENSSRGALGAGDANRESDGVEKLLWNDFSEEEYLKQMVGLDDTVDSYDFEEVPADTLTLSSAIKAMDDIRIDEDASLIERRHISSSLEKMVRLGRKKELSGSDSIGDSAKNQYNLDISHDDDDNNTVDEMIEDIEREEEINLNNILELIPVISDPISTKNIRTNVSKTFRDSQGSPASCSRKKTLTCAMNNSFDSKKNIRDCNDTLAGDETIGKIVTHMVDAGISTAGGEEERTLRSWTDFHPIAGSVATPVSKNSVFEDNSKSNSGGDGEGVLAGINNSNNRFVNDDTSVGSISDEIDVIVTKHKRKLADEANANKHSKPGDALTIQYTMISSLSFDATHYARIRSQLGVMPSTDENEAATPEPESKPKVEGDNNNDMEKGESEPWWVRAEKIPTTPERTSYGTPSPQNSVGKPKEAPDTPSTLIIRGLATSDVDSDEYDDTQFTRTSKKAYVKRRNFTHLRHLDFLKRASEKYGKIYLWAIISALAMLVLSVILLIVASVKLGRSDQDSNEMRNPPMIVPESEMSPSIEWTFADRDGIDTATISPNPSDIRDEIFQTDPPTESRTDPPTESPDLPSSEDGSSEISPSTETPDLISSEDESSQIRLPTKSPDLPSSEDESPLTRLPTKSPDLPATDDDDNESEFSSLGGIVDFFADPALDQPQTNDNETSDNILSSGDHPDFIFFNERLRKAILAKLPESIPKFDDPTTPQSRALEWLRSNPPSIEELKFKPLVQRYVMAVLYFSTNGEEWLENTDWLSSKDECQWFSTSTKDATCDSIGRVVEIDLRSNNLKGSLPSEMILLSDYITRIRINGNSLEGEIPSSLREMTNLERFHVHWNYISGAVPAELGELSKLLSLRLGHNDFVGTIPWQVGNLQRLEALTLNSNELKGTIPLHLGDLSTLNELDLSNNELSGTIPIEFMKLSSMVNLKLEGNSLTGSMPTEVCSRLPLMEIARVDCEGVSCWCCEGCNN